ncbi:hypothetical protein [Variovorax sp. UMC13]|uniref:hypothetical protein n=1 Tax=Variovorax sp. UMC13 TaxID=1862326 RepID=UPI001601B2C4|nr:hypothetical protein [Variovorax sp. UMC13]MBB1600549.1 hypothetical protein [Variovorax sp. UMC13]
MITRIGIPGAAVTISRMFTLRQVISRPSCSRCRAARRGPLTQLLRRLGQAYTMHGFRSSFRTWGMEATQYPDEMLEFALAHVVGDQTVRAYARSVMVAKRRHLMEDWAKYVTSRIE